MHLLFPFASSIFYVVAALFLKQAAAGGIGPWRTGFVCNWIVAAFFALLLPLGGQIPSVALLYQPALNGMLFVAGQILTFLALQKGDVSVATPVLGSKVILVALFTTVLLGEAVRPALWAAAACACIGIAFLNRSGSSSHRHVVRTIWLSLLAACAYSLFDVLVMKWAPAWGAGRYLPFTMLAAGVFSIGFIPFFRKPLGAVAPAGKALAYGGFFLAMQAILLVYALAVFQDGTALNVIYSLRGLWSVLAVWWLGHWFANRERDAGAATMGWRLAGAGLLCTAVALVFV